MAGVASWRWWAIPALLSLLMAAGYGWWHASNPQRMTPDSTEYARIAMTMRGLPADVAAREAAMVRCVGLFHDPVDGYPERIDNHLSVEGVAERAAAVEAARAGRYAEVPADWLGPCTVYVTDHPVSEDPRYSRIFESRPLYPALVAVVSGFTTPYSALLAVSLGAAVLAGILTFLTVGVAGWGRAAAVVAQGLVYLLPTGNQGPRPLTEGLTWLAVSVLLLGVTLALRGARGWGIALQLAGAALLVATRYPTALFAGVAVLALLGLAAVLRPRLDWREAWPATAGPMLGVVGALLVPPILGWASGADSVQDQVADHFTKPDVANPYLQLAAEVKDLLLDVVADPYFLQSAALVAALLVAAVLLRPEPSVLVLVCAPLLVALGNIVAHPALGEARRLFSFASASVAFGCAVVVAAAIARRTGPSDG